MAIQHKEAPNRQSQRVQHGLPVSSLIFAQICFVIEKFYLTIRRDSNDEIVTYAPHKQRIFVLKQMF